MAKKPKKDKPQPPAKERPNVTFTRGAKLSEPQDEPDLFTEFTEIADPKKRAFLAACMTTPRIGKACKMAGISAKTSWNWRHDPNDPQFLEAYYTARRLGVERAESELWRRGVEGVEEPVYHQGQLVGSKKTYDTTAAIFMLKGELPEKYAEQRRLAAPGGGPVQTESVVVTADLSDEEILLRAERLRTALLTGTRLPDIEATATPVDPEAERLAAYAKKLAERNGGNGNGSHG